MAVDDELRPAPIEQASVASERRDRVASSPVPVGGVGWVIRPRPWSSSGRSRLTCSRDPNSPPFGTRHRGTDRRGQGIRRAGGRLGAHGDRVGGQTLGHGSAGPSLPARSGDGRDGVARRGRRTNRRHRRRRRGVGHERLQGGRRSRWWCEQIDPVGESPSRPSGRRRARRRSRGADRVWVTDTATGEVQIHDPPHQVKTIEAGRGIGRSTPPRADRR